MATITPTPTQFDPDAIYSGLLAHASALHASYSVASDVPVVALLAHHAQPTPAPSAASLSSSDQSNKIYDALEQWASSMKGQGYEEGFPKVQANLAQTDLDLTTGVVSFAMHNADPSQPVGLISHYFDKLPHPLLALLTILLLTFALFFTLFGARSVHILSRWGKTRGTETSRGIMEGGLGGLLGGMLLGGISATLATVGALRNQDGLKDRLQPIPFIAIAAASAALVGIIAGRFRWVGRAALAMVGGYAIVEIIVMTFTIGHLLPRLVLLAIFVPFFTLLAIFPAFPRRVTALLPVSFPTRTLIVATAATAGWVFVIAVDMWITTGWVDGPSLLEKQLGIRSVEGAAQADGDSNVRIINWDQASFKGLLAAAWLITAISVAWQSWRYKEFGEDPDEQWDKYLSSYLEQDRKTSEHRGLNDPERAGRFLPPPTVWDRLFGASDDRHARGRPLTEMPSSRRRDTGRGTLDEPWDEKHGHDSLVAPRLAYLDGGDDDDDDEVGTLVGSAPGGVFKSKYHQKSGEDIANEPISPPAVKFDDSPRSSRPASWSRAAQQERKLTRKGSRGSAVSRNTDITAVSATQSHGRAFGYDDKVKRLAESDEESDDDGDVGNSPSARKSMDRSEQAEGGFIKSFFNGKAKGPARYDGIGKARPRGVSGDHSSLHAPRPTQTRHDSIAAPEAVAVEETVTPPPIPTVSVAPAPSSASTSEQVVSAPAPEPSSNLKAVEDRFAAVPATPSLINALERISQAQKQAREYRAAHGEGTSAPAAPPSLPSKTGDSPISAALKPKTSPRPIDEIRRTSSVKRKSQVWDSWWSEVTQKAAEEERAANGGKR